MPQKILVMQTAFIGDAILASGLLESLHQRFPDAQLSILVRKGNDGLYAHHPYLHRVFVWNKKDGKYKSMKGVITQLREERFDWVINLQRFASSGIIAAFSGGKVIGGFSKNPMSFLFHKKADHKIGEGTHETERNLQLGHVFDTDLVYARPKLYPSPKDYAAVLAYQSEAYVTMAPSSVWFTKQFPKERWIDLIRELPFEGKIYLLGAPNDASLCEDIIKASGHTKAVNLAGKLGLTASAALMEKAKMNYVNDSAPMHLASSVNAPVCAIYCSTVPEFGFGPLSDQSHVAEVKGLECRPCGLHGHKACPKEHFKCGTDIDLESLKALVR